MQKQKRVFIIHGWDATPETDFFPWLKKELEAKDFSVMVPTMPDTSHPTLGRWLPCLQNIVGTIDINTYFVGHSLGVITILRYLESLPADQKVGGAVLVAGFAEAIEATEDEEFESFFRTPLDFEKVLCTADKFVAIHSDNDPAVPFDQGELLQDKLGAKLVVVPSGGHFDSDDGFTKFPAVLESVLEIAHEKV